jgi:uncharacterized membrane protein YkoI
MKAYHKITAGVALLLVAPLFAQQEIRPEHVPDAARRALERAAGTDPIRSIIRQVEDGRTVYIAEIERDNAINPRLRVSEYGELLPAPAVTGGTDPTLLALDPTSPAPVRYDPAPLTVESLPKAVQETVRREARDRTVADIDREVSEGRTVYEVEFRAEGRNPQLHVAEDGSIVRGDESRRGLRDFFLGTQLSDTPSAAQETIRREAAGRPINDIDIERRTGSVIYEVEIRDPQSGVFQLHVDPDGRIVKDSRQDAPESRR